MTVKELINKLSIIDKDLEVLTYIEQAKEYGEIQEVTIITNNEMPYSKQESPIMKPGEEIVLLQGDTYFN